MFIQGDLQAIFDALFAVGAVDPVIKENWQLIEKDMVDNQGIVQSVIQIVNTCHGDRSKLIQTLSLLDQRRRNFIALELAREFAESQDRKILH